MRPARLDYRGLSVLAPGTHPREALRVTQGGPPPWLARVRGPWVAWVTMRRDAAMHPRELKSMAGQHWTMVSGLTGRRCRPPASEALSTLGTPLRCVHSAPDVGPWGWDKGPGGRDTWWKGREASTASESDKAGWPYGPALAAFRVALAQRGGVGWWRCLHPGLSASWWGEFAGQVGF